MQSWVWATVLGTNHCDTYLVVMTILTRPVLCYTCFARRSLLSSGLSYRVCVQLQNRYEQKAPSMQARLST